MSDKAGNFGAHNQEVERETLTSHIHSQTHTDTNAQTRMYTIAMIQHRDTNSHCE